MPELSKTAKALAELAEQHVHQRVELQKQIEEEERFKKQEEERKWEAERDTAKAQMIVKKSLRYRN